MAGKKKLTTGYNYWGSSAGLVGHGELTRLLEISNGDTPIWEGPIDSSSADSDGKSTLNTTLGLIDFFWGSATQEPHTLLASLEIDLGSGPQFLPTPAYRGVSYIVQDDLAFGGQTIPPTLLVWFERQIEVLDLSAHEIDGDAVIPEILYDLLTNTVYGCELIPDLEIDTESFEAAAEITIDEGIGCSMDVDTVTDARELVGQLLSHIDGFVYLKHGRLHLGLSRKESAEGLAVIDESDLLDEPRPLPTQFEGTWNKTIVTFTDRENKWEESSEEYDDPANAAILQKTVTKEFNFPWVTSRAVAKNLAKRLGIRGGLPVCLWELTLKPVHASLSVGDRFKLSVDMFGVTERVVRVKRIRKGSPNMPEVSVTVEEDWTRDPANDYVPPADNFSVPGVLGPDGTGDFTLTSTTPRLSTLPEELRGDAADGLLVACERPDGMTIGGTVYWTWDPALQPYRSIGEFNKFPAKAEVISWHRIRTDKWLFRLKVEGANYDWLQALVEEATALYAVVGRRDYKSTGTPKDEHQVMAAWLKCVPGGIFELQSAEVVDIELEGAAFGTDDLLLETSSDDGLYPTLHAYFGRVSDFFLHPTNEIFFERSGGNALGDSGEERHFKVPVANHVNEEALTDVSATTFDRDDSTMSADGTLSTEWGPRAVTMYELFDEVAGEELAGTADPDEYAWIEDIDEALGAVLEGDSTADQDLLVEHIDEVLGFMIENGSTRYNDE
jgi:hypothetical protein